ncbi:MAG: hypothetical protein HOA17_09305 [Candidatus Melainabacteria bacterium]|jgi:hypothetical protein|nr:hypothetical protein [Candidatus Melainabacteria bacterium]
MNKLLEKIDFKSRKTRIIAIMIIVGLAWSSSITNEFTGYDDIKLIVNNDKVHNDLFYTLKFYWNIVSDSHNVCWTNFPTVIYRPLEWFGSAVGYHIWGPQAWAYHFFVNFNFHILNTIILFFILSKIFGTATNGTEAVPAETPVESKLKSKSKKHSKSKAIVMESARISWWVPLVITIIWAIHPLHNEAVNMLTSGVGFLWSTLLCLTCILINLYVKDLRSPLGLFLIVIAWACQYISYHGSEMMVIATPVLIFIFFNSIVKRDYKSYGYEIAKIFFMITSFLTYYAHRSNIVSEQGEWAAKSLADFIERVTVVAPQIFFHHIRLFFFPNKLSMDEHHNVWLDNPYSLFHIMCFIIAAAFCFGIFHYLTAKDPKYQIHDRILGGALFFAGFSISISINIIPLYCLARDRYTYFFVMGMVIAIIVALDKYIFSRGNYNTTKWLAILAIVICALGARSWVKSWDWHDGERFWSHAMNSVDDIGAKQNWRYRLIQYYQDQGTKTFKPNEELKAQAQKDFNEFGIVNKLNDKEVIKSYLDAAKDPKNYLKNKYGYIGNKTLASALFFNATTAIEKRDGVNALNYFKLAHLYYPEHFQTNLQMFIHTFGKDDKFTNYLLAKMEKDASNNSFLAKGLMDGMFFIKHPRVYEYASMYKDKFPNTQVFHVYAFHGALFKQKYDDAYHLAKKIVKKYHENPIFDKYIKKYEHGDYNSIIQKLSENK